MFVDFNILNQLGSPSINSNTFANRPAAGQTGRLFVSTDTFEIYRDNGTGWDLIGGPGAGTITGTGTATQVAYFTGAQTIGSSANLFWDNTNTRLGIGTSSPGVRLDVHGTGNMLQLNATAATANTLMSFQRLGSNVWRLGDQYSGGLNYFELHNAVINNNAAEFQAATNKATFGALETYSSGGATGSLFSYTLTVPDGTNFTGPNVIGNVNSALVLNLGGNTTVPNSTRQGLEGNSRINFTGPGTLTMTQGTGTVRAFSAISSVYSFAGSSAGTITHLAGLRVCFPDSIGLGAISITNNYAILINDQTAGLGTVTYTNRWGIYQEGASDLNYLNGNLLIKSTTNTGEALQVTGTAKVTSTLTANSLVKSGGTASQILAADGSVITAGTNITIAAGTISASGGLAGSGTTNYLPKFTAATTLGNSNLLDDGSNLSLSLNTFRIKNGVGNTSFVRAEENTTNASFTYLTMDARSTGYLSFSTNDLERMRITSAGLVGINTTTIGSRLQVNGGAAIGYSASTAAPTNGLAVAGVVGIGSNSVTNGTVYGGSNQVNVLKLSSSGYPALEVNSTSDGGGSIQFTHGVNLPNQARALIGYNSASATVLDFNINNIANGPIIFGTNNTNRMTITGGGQVTLATGANVSSIAQTGYSLTGANAQSLIDLAGTWNTTGNPTAIKLNITNTASGATAYLMDLQVGAATQFRVTKAGAIRTAAPTTGTANDWKLGTRVAAAVVLDTTQYIELEVGGTLYKLAIVT